MSNIPALRRALRRALLASFAAVLCAGTAARAGDLEDAAKLLKDGRREAALEQVNKALAVKPGDPQARFLEGVIFTELGRTKEAVAVFEKLTKDYPQLPEPYNNLAVIYAGQGHYEQAREALERSIRTHPSYATAYENLGDVYAKLASRAYDRALQLDSSNSGAQEKLALVSELVGEPNVLAAKTAQGEKPKPEEKPKEEEKRAAPPAPKADDSAAVLAAVNGWAKAWSDKDVPAYLGFYAKDFRPPHGQPRQKWEAMRSARLQHPKWISVSVSDPRVRFTGPGEASVSFRQSYRSSSFKSDMRKTLRLVKTDAGWRIGEESAR